MKATKLVTSAAVVTLGLTLLAPSVLAASATTYNGEGKITYKEGDGGTVPIDPEIVDPIEPPVKPNPENGPLRVEFATTLDFGEQDITANKGEYFAKEVEVTDAEDATKKANRGNFIQIADLRSLDDNGKTKGWNLTAELTEQFASAKNSTLNGAYLSYSNPFVNAVKPNENFNPSDEVQTVSNVDLKLNETKSMARAEVGRGFGVYTIEYGRPAATDNNQNGFTNDTKTSHKSVKLTVPANTPLQKEEYKSTITWTMNEL